MINLKTVKINNVSNSIVLVMIKNIFDILNNVEIMKMDLENEM
jgi:hypothetical protein